CGPAWLGQKAAFYAWVRETNRRPFGHGVVAIYFGLYWIINTLATIYTMAASGIAFGILAPTNTLFLPTCFSLCGISL
ncbi:hypothetical protein, partial [Aneurinibacillus aneurinilyticus]|uniref:hypothetical protein n=1 Tax=Aneurinibacillus aneurinilyticus TaxID=1391 RepID=UPI003525DAC3